ncbi:MAG TPA: KTSC domain-containing protein [Bacilli bacterium]
MVGNLAITFESKQIASVGYDNQSMELVARYFTGEIRRYEDIPLHDYLNLVESTNPYDYFVKITTSRR